METVGAFPELFKISFIFGEASDCYGFGLIAEGGVIFLRLKNFPDDVFSIFLPPFTIGS